jgi:hypothetical protein
VQVDHSWYGQACWITATDGYSWCLWPWELLPSILYHYPILANQKLNFWSKTESSLLQPDHWLQIFCRLKIKLPNHDPNDFYPLFEINKAAKHVLHGTSQNSLLQSGITLTAPPTQLVSLYIKVEDLLTPLKMAQSFLKVLTPQKSTTNTASSSTNTQATTSLDLLSCAFCGQSGHCIVQCLVCVDYITNEKCKRNLEVKIVLSNGQFTPHSIHGQFIKDQIDEWHKHKPLNPLPLPSCMKLTQWHCQVKPVLLPTWSWY